MDSKDASLIGLDWFMQDSVNEVESAFVRNKRYAWKQVIGAVVVQQ